MTYKVIHFGWDDCYRIQVLRYAGYEVRDCQSIENLGEELQCDAPPDLIVISEDDSRSLPQTTAMVRSHTKAPLILFRRTQNMIDESIFERVFPCLAPPELWLSEVEEVIGKREAHDMRDTLQTHTGTLIAEAAIECENFPKSASVFDRVRVRGREELFLVVRISPDGSSVDLVQLAGTFEVERGIPLTSLERVNERNRLL